ncbi:hypothetical protein FOZ61_009349 [Perkinsus olseni]|uniref:Uncharacterized protein n=1 Tax=Perkinsus olseni TaxID=32597 RepID=A0A7J6L093_PEROL|nr:hypothetical protein FOZ61_009349 [Perkinsus olseni]KAF4654970.1 hypothetical protein FOL46_008446 [Perkinsus olseni]
MVGRLPTGVNPYLPVRNFVVSTAAGLERSLLRELEVIFATITVPPEHPAFAEPPPPPSLSIVRGGVECTVTSQVPGSISCPDRYIWSSVLSSRVADGVRVRMRPKQQCSWEKHLNFLLRDVKWGEFIPLEAPVPEIVVKSVNSRLYHPKHIARFVEEELVNKREFITASRNSRNFDDATEAEIGSSGVDPSGLYAPRILVNVVDNSFEMCAEASGSPIRAYLPNEAARGVVPPHAAAACLQESPLMQLLEEGEECTLWDPFLHSTSFCLEGAAIIMGVPPGSPAMDYPFTQYPTHDHMEYSRLVDDIDVTRHKFMSNLTILGTSTNSEIIAKALRDVGAFKAALPRRVVAETEAPLAQTSKYGTVAEFLADTPTPARREGRVHDDSIPMPKLLIQRRGWQDAGLDPPHNCMILTHIPRGGRKEETNRVYQEFGRMVLSNGGKWRAVMVVVSEDGKFESLSGLDWMRVFSFSHEGERFAFLKWTGRRQKKIS